MMIGPSRFPIIKDVKAIAYLGKGVLDPVILRSFASRVVPWRLAQSCGMYPHICVTM